MSIPTAPFASASWFELLKSEIRSIGAGKIHVSANESISAFGGDDFFVEQTEGVSWDVEQTEGASWDVEQTEGVSWDVEQTEGVSWDVEQTEGVSWDAKILVVVRRGQKDALCYYFYRIYISPTKVCGRN